jgi:hypothetical protein
MRSGCKFYVLGFRVLGFGQLRVEGSEFRVQSLDLAMASLMVEGCRIVTLL